MWLHHFRAWYTQVKTLWVCFFSQPPSSLQTVEVQYCSDETDSCWWDVKACCQEKLFYHSVISGLQNLLARNGFLQLCDHWRQHSSSIPECTYADIYDSHVWKEFMYINGQPFLYTLPWKLVFNVKHRLVQSLWWHRIFCWCYLPCCSKPTAIWAFQSWKYYSYWLDTRTNRAFKNH